MSFTVERLPSEPILLLTITEPHGPQEMPDIHAAVAAEANQIDGKVYRVTDLTRSGLTFAVLVQTLAEAARGQAGSGSDAKMMPIYVGSEQITELIKEAFAQEQYGGKHVEIFATVDEAVARARELRVQIA